MKIRFHQPSDNASIVRLFFDTVHSINAKDYNEAQRNAWAPPFIDAQKWCAPFAADYTIVAEEEGLVVGFANLDAIGHLDRLYVHKDHQRQGIAKGLLDALEAHARSAGMQEIISFVSITAKPFFEKRGYQVIRENTVVRGGQSMRNYKMRKRVR